ncbi:MAG: 3-hydroxyacyl-CoA dehydrogenase family protein [Actinobacteria bacterium]|nr:MAG: 3-hydroxyacyl-CoA dehydrogenase family protein [Actinomycetota bacterium]
MGRISVIGAGLMGHGIAQVFAAHGHAVSLMDVEQSCLERALTNIRESLALLAEYDIVRSEDRDVIIDRITTTTSLQEAAAGADFVIEAVSERPDLKRSIFRELDALCLPRTILATNTSVISITEIARDAASRERVVGTHFWNPPQLIPLVEVIPGRDSAPWAIDRAYDLLRSVGKHPVRVKKDAPGFVGNRMQHALWREAISIVERGIADAETVDEVVKMGFGLRLPVLGSLENADMVGLDLTLHIHDYILRHIEDSHEPSRLLKEKVERGELGFASGRGLKEWTPQKMGACRAGLQRHLMEWGSR